MNPGNRRKLLTWDFQFQILGTPSLGQLLFPCIYFSLRTLLWWNPRKLRYQDHCHGNGKADLWMFLENTPFCKVLLSTRPRTELQLWFIRQIVLNLWPKELCSKCTHLKNIQRISPWLWSRPSPTRPLCTSVPVCDSTGLHGHSHSAQKEQAASCSWGPCPHQKEAQEAFLAPSHPPAVNVNQAPCWISVGAVTPCGSSPQVSRQVVRG